MSEFSRRSLLGGAVVAAAASTMWTEPVHAQYVWQKSDWHAAEFDALTHTARRVKLVVHGFAINDGRFLKNAKNSLTGLQFGSGIAADQIQVACALNGPDRAGDFNDWRRKGDRILTDELGVYEVFEEVKGRPARTFPSVMPVFRLDRIYARKLDVNDAHVHYAFPSGRLSDHAALAATFSLPRQRR